MMIRAEIFFEEVGIACTVMTCLCMSSAMAFVLLVRGKYTIKILLASCEAAAGLLIVCAFAEEKAPINKKKASSNCFVKVVCFISSIRLRRAISVIELAVNHLLRLPGIPSALHVDAGKSRCNRCQITGTQCQVNSPQVLFQPVNFGRARNGDNPRILG